MEHAGANYGNQMKTIDGKWLCKAFVESTETDRAKGAPTVTATLLRSFLAPCHEHGLGKTQPSMLLSKLQVPDPPWEALRFGGTSWPDQDDQKCIETDVPTTQGPDPRLPNPAVEARGLGGASLTGASSDLQRKGGSTAVQRSRRRGCRLPCPQ